MDTTFSSSSQLQKDIQQIDRLSHLLDDQFKIPGTSIGFGYDSLLGLLPVAGDSISLGISFYVLYLARHFKLPKRKIFKMFFNVGFDFFIGLIPLIGDLLDIASKANLKNLRMIKAHLENTHAQNPTSL